MVVSEGENQTGLCKQRTSFKRDETFKTDSEKSSKPGVVQYVVSLTRLLMVCDETYKH